MKSRADLPPCNKGRILNLTNDEMMTINLYSKDYFRQYKCGRYK